ncbi:small subunit ribosomal protein S6e [Vigna unguiculata]|uniref:Small subunit ribosomal protein S6e n=1 Tax=Vigna unguiculata TaxID=3917 RepID=A0A4D6M6M7_VIGUN|nr:small subunit ribosomal protein S6e [Vigna unguiculata]
MVSLGTGQESYFMMDYGLNGFEHMVAGKKAAEYPKLFVSMLKEERERRSESLAKKRFKLSGATKAAI